MTWLPPHCAAMTAPLIAAWWLAAPSDSLVPQTITVIGVNYAFEIPAHIHAGATLMRFENRGTVRHMMVIGALRADLPVDSALRALAHGIPAGDLLDGQEGAIVSSPNEAPGPEVSIDLHAGTRYLVYCVAHDGPGKPAHTALGMLASFRPE